MKLCGTGKAGMAGCRALRKGTVAEREKDTHGRKESRGTNRE